MAADSSHSSQQPLDWASPLLVIDSHTGGEPTRVILDGGPDLSGMNPLEARQKLRQQYEDFRQAIINEPRGNDVLVGALRLPSTRPDTLCGVVFFNNVGYLGMCGHGLIGLMATLVQQGEIVFDSDSETPQTYRIETPVGVVSATLHSPNQVQITNVASYRLREKVTVQTEHFGPITGDIAWGGNWFFLVNQHDQDLKIDRWRQLTEFCLDVQASLQRAGIFGKNQESQADEIIDHIELFGSSLTGADSQSFVLCPGIAYDRSPCGTGCSAKIACLAADQKLGPNQPWIQESITGSRFQIQYELLNSDSPLWPKNLAAEAGPVVIPQVTGQAYVYAETKLFFDPQDRFRLGIR